MSVARAWEVMEDRCLKTRVKEASGISIFLTEEIGDARLRCNQLKDYIDEAVHLIEKSEHRDHFFEVAGHLLHAIPDTLMRIDKALSAAAMGVAKWEYEDIKEDIRPEKAEQLEDALKDVRVRRVKRKSSQRESSMRVQVATEQLKQIAASIEETGRIDAGPLAQLISSLEGNSVRTASSNVEVAGVLRGLAKGLGDGGRPNRLMLAAILRRVLGDTIELRTAAVSKAADGADSETSYNVAQGFEYIRSAALVAYRRGGSGNQMRQAFDQLASIVSEIGVMCDSIGATDVAGLAIRMSKAVRLARRLLKPDVLDSLVLASDEKESRFEEGKPSDPTSEMSEDDAEKWKANTDKYEDKFKSATVESSSDAEDDEIVEAGSAKGLVPKVRPKKYSSGEKESRFEEGKPSDPTSEMSEDDAEQWKANTDKYEDKFKSASSGEIQKIIRKMNKGMGEREVFSLLEEALSDHKITSSEFRSLEAEAEDFFDPDYKTASARNEPWKA